MPLIYLGIGSNMDRTRHIVSGLDMLSDALGEMIISSVYESAAVGFDGDPFYNLAVGVESTMELAQLKTLLKTIEDMNGRDRAGPKFSARTLDIDVLTYGDLVGRYEGVLLPRAEITQNAHVLLPMAEIAGELKLPGTDQSYRALWEDYDKTRQQLWTVDFEWRGRKISRAGG